MASHTLFSRRTDGGNRSGKVKMFLRELALIIFLKTWKSSPIFSFDASGEGLLSMTTVWERRGLLLEFTVDIGPLEDVTFIL